MQVEKQCCPTCGQNISPRRITLYKGLADALYRVYEWCLKNKVHEFTRKDIKHLMLDENCTARFGDWVMFGGLVYKDGKGNYGLNLERCKNFFENKLSIPSTILKDPITQTLEKTDYKTISEIQPLTDYLDVQGNYTGHIV